MVDRGTGRTPAGSLPLRSLALLIAALLLSSGPVLAATAGRPAAQGRVGGTADQLQGDPIGDLAFELDYDLESIFRFVADEISYEPYPGILRGALGTLQARAGNSADKAQLLAALLDASQIRYRFARGSLDETVSAQLLDTLPLDVEAARRLARRPLDAGEEQLASRDPLAEPLPSIPVAPSLKPDAELKAEGKARLELAATRLGDTVTMLQTVLEDAGIRLPAIEASLPPAEVTGHTWVQARAGSEWRDLDPTLAGAEPGSVLTAASETVDRLPDDLRHRVRFEVLVERVQGGQLVIDSILEHEDFADRLAGTPVVFGHVTPSALKTLGITLSSLFGNGWMDYRPVLDLGGQAFVADEAVAFPLGAGSDIFSTEASPTAGPLEGEATAEWLQVSVTPPGAEAAVARRTVFDRIPPESRHGGIPSIDAVAPVTLVDLEATGSVDYPPMQGAEYFAIATGPTSVADLIEAPHDDGLGILALAYHNVRDVMSTSMVLDAGARTFLDGPNVVSVSLRIDPDATEGYRDAVRFGFDIWHRDHGVLPLARGPVTTGSAGLMAGVTDHLAERFAMEFVGDASIGTQATLGVGEIFEAAAEQGIPTLVVHGDMPSGLGYGPEAMAAIGRLVAAGDVVVVPAEPVTIGDTARVGWWAIDPRTGETTDAMDDGSGAVLAEDTFVRTRTTRSLVRCYGALGAQVAALIAAATTQLRVIELMTNWSPQAGRAGACVFI
ncbi:MAG: hypothetical protein ABWZ82_11475 [Candidatus Limnocylindrales bacterium]